MNQLESKDIYGTAQYSWQGAPTTSTFNQLTPQGAQGASVAGSSESSKL